jgi:putative spermidine/putrescine transport system ATP-binding protein
MRAPELNSKNPSPALSVRNLRKTFAKGSHAAVDNVSLDVWAGEVVSILGPSGCGKTTTMRLIAGLESPDSGEVFVEGTSILSFPPHKRRVGLVFQDHALFPHKTIFENIAFGLRMAREDRAQIKRRVAEVLELVRLSATKFSDRWPAELSGGERQRVAVARTIIVEPAVVLFDEPMASLDRRLRDHMAGELRELQKRLGIASLYVTHDQETASMMSDRIAVMNAGAIVQIGSPLEIYAEPQSRFVADFIGDTNFLPARIVSSGESGTEIQVFERSVILPGSQSYGNERVNLAVRPEDLQLSDHPGLLVLAEGQQVSAQFVSGVYIQRVKLADGRIIVARGRTEGYPGQKVWVEANPNSIRLLRE